MATSTESEAAGTVASDDAWRADRPEAVVADAVEELLGEFLAAARERICALGVDAEPLVVTARDLVLSGGKRLRPTFAYWGWRGAAPDDPVQPVLPAFAALELLHAFAIIQDDVMDESLVRRGQPTVHTTLAAHHAERGLRGDPESFGRSGAVLVGDLCMVWADQMLASAKMSSDVIATARHVYDDMRERTITGQFLDILGEASPVWPVEQALSVDRLKTAYYTVVGPLRYGAALAGQAPSPHDPLDACYTRYGLAVGEAFQLRDDLLDCYGDPGLTGKPKGTDLLSGKPTLLLRLARGMANTRQRTELERHLADPAMDPTQLAAVITETGAVSLVEWTIANRVNEAEQAVADAPLTEPVKAALVRLARYATSRAT